MRFSADVIDTPLATAARECLSLNALVIFQAVYHRETVAANGDTKRTFGHCVAIIGGYINRKQI